MRLILLNLIIILILTAYIVIELQNVTIADFRPREQREQDILIMRTLLAGWLALIVIIIGQVVWHFKSRK